jgi:hypothetical protein
MTKDDPAIQLIRDVRHQISAAVDHDPRRLVAHYMDMDERYRQQHERIARLKTPDECEQFAINVQTRLPDLARAARIRAVELLAASHGAKSDTEREALEAIYAHERVLSKLRGKNVRASRTWQMIKRHGILPAVERAVNRRSDAAGYTALVELGMQEFAFERVVERHPEQFSKEALVRSSERLNRWRTPSANQRS